MRECAIFCQEGGEAFGAIPPARFVHRTKNVARHGQMYRSPERDMMLLTSGGWLTHMTTDDIALVGFDSTVRAGQLPGGTFEIVEMHSKVYEKRPDIGAIIHTHSPYATAFAIANRPLPCVYEAMARFDMHDGVPVAPYAPRGSKESVANILSVIGPKTRCVLLQNHGILAFGESIEMAT